MTKTPFKLPSSAKDLITKANETTEVRDEANVKEAIKEFANDIIAFTEQEGKGFGDNDEAYVFEYGFLHKSGKMLIDQSPYLYANEAEAIIGDEIPGAKALIDYNRGTYEGVIGVQRPKLVKIYKH